jgi:catechol 2,3-dioxygenase-like lactoylglutathione lyase family enzyme
MITGAHTVIYSTDAEADRAFFRDVLGFSHVDAGDGWLIFGLPPSEVAVHPAEESGKHELYLMCDDAEAFISEMAAKGYECESPKNVGWGVLTRLTLPGGGTVGVYEPRHARP